MKKKKRKKKKRGRKSCEFNRGGKVDDGHHACTNYYF